ncbi:MAG TPA: TIGR02444 family protein [Caulobacteraceae bacterium]|jgi:uncharacterized protein (TIGR02444 family)
MTREALWPYALEVYGRPGAEPLLLELQDAHGQCAPYLIWALWVAASGRGVDAARAAQAAELARAWQDAAVVPLRRLRRELKADARAGPKAPRERLRERVKGLELEAERMLLQMLQDASSAPAAAAPIAAAQALALATAAWGGDPPAGLIARLADLAG